MNFLCGLLIFINMKPRYQKIPTSEYKNIIKLYETNSTTAIAKIYGVERVTISRILKKIGVPVGKYQTTANKWINRLCSKTQLEIVNKYNDGCSVKSLTTDYSLREFVVRLILKNNNVNLRDHNYEQRKYHINFEYFKKIDSPDKAYFLGLIYSDGCNTRRGLTIFLSEDDSYILRDFASKIHLGKYNMIFNKAKKTSHSNSIGFVASSRELSDQLSSLGAVPKKSLVLQFPTRSQVPNEYIWHFVRGYFDGDGCVYIKNGNRNIVDFVGSHDFIEGLNKFLDSECVFGRVYRYKNQNTSNLKIMKQSSVNIFYKKCYENSDNIYLKRKYNKFIQ